MTMAGIVSMQHLSSCSVLPRSRFLSGCAINSGDQVSHGAKFTGIPPSKRTHVPVVMASSSDKDDFSSGTGKKPSGPLLKAAWYGSELLGQLAAALTPSREKDSNAPAQKLQTDGKPIDRKQAAAIIRKDYESSYFVTGEMTTSLYADDCEYADPFVSFKGTDRFIRNVSNLGKFMLEANLDITDWEEQADRIAVGWRFRCVLDLPWTPTLAASGQNTYVFGDSGQVVRHIERWNISPVDGLRQLVRPGRKPAAKSGASKK
eukprot:jgi/Mesvir1/15982/Mv08289-RA.1